MIRLIDIFLDRITMYRLVLYYLIFLIFSAVVLSLFKLLPFSPWMLLLSTILITFCCWISNLIFSRFLNAPTNIESLYITALILALIITPELSFYKIMFIIWAAVWAMGSKYIFAIGKKHIFNPAAFAVALTEITINQSATWWIGTLYMLPFVFAGGLLVVRKMRRFDLVLGFFISAMAAIIGFGLFRGTDVIATAGKALSGSSMVFFAFVMLTEPLTTPPTRVLRILYGTLVGFLFTPMVSIGSISLTPELSLLIGNVFSYIVSPKEKLLLKLKGKVQVASDAYNFLFVSDKKLLFRPGQYMEWTLPVKHADNRGNRRYFTIASSPTENEIEIGIRFSPKSSTFKKELMSLGAGGTIVASQLAGDFTLPKNPQQKLVFIAGGIGATPFRSMVKYLLDRGEKRQIILFYSNRCSADIAYKDIFDIAQKLLGIKVVYTVTDPNLVSTDWKGKMGYINQQMIIEEVPDYMERTFYVSGPHTMVTAFKEILKNMGVKKGSIKTDYFPGFA